MNEEYWQTYFGGVGPVPIGDVIGRRRVVGQKAKESPRKDGQESTVRDVVIRKAMNGE
jgi:hypothetical protein